MNEATLTLELKYTDMSQNQIKLENLYRFPALKLQHHYLRKDQSPAGRPGVAGEHRRNPPDSTLGHVECHWCHWWCHLEIHLHLNQELKGSCKTHEDDESAFTDTHKHTYEHTRLSPYARRLSGQAQNGRHSQVTLGQRGRNGLLRALWCSSLAFLLMLLTERWRLGFLQWPVPLNLLVVVVRSPADITSKEIVL